MVTFFNHIQFSSTNTENFATDAGFEQPLTSCCGHGGGAFNFDFNVRCGDAGSVNGTEVLLGKPCENPYTRIIWDGIHFTEAANRWVFDQIASGECSYPRASLDVACRRVNRAA